MSQSDDNTEHAATAIDNALKTGPDEFGPLFRPVNEMMQEWRRTNTLNQSLKEKVSSLEKSVVRLKAKLHHLRKNYES